MTVDQIQTGLSPRAALRPDHPYAVRTEQAPQPACRSSQVIAPQNGLRRRSPDPALSSHERDWVQGPLFWISHIAALLLVTVLLGIFLGFAVVIGGGE